MRLAAFLLFAFSGMIPLAHAVLAATLHAEWPADGEQVAILWLLAHVGIMGAIYLFGKNRPQGNF